MHAHICKRKSGFTMIEVLVAMVILAILAAIAIPAFSRWLPNYRLRSAARDLYSNLQLAKLEAIKTNTQWAMVLDTGSNSYRICSDDGGDGDWTDGDEAVEKTVVLAEYESGVRFEGPGGEASACPLTFNSRGLSPDSGDVYLSNTKNTAYYKVGIPSISGVVKLERWNGGTWE